MGQLMSREISGSVARDLRKCSNSNGEIRLKKTWPCCVKTKEVKTQEVITSGYRSNIHLGSQARHREDVDNTHIHETGQADLGMVHRTALRGCLFELGLVAHFEQRKPLELLLRCTEHGVVAVLVGRLRQS